MTIKRDEVFRLKKKIAQILRKRGVSKASIFGSFARQEKKYNDIDILIKFKKGKSLLDLCHLESELEERLGKKVDLLTYNSIHPLIRKIVLAEKVDIL